MYTRPRHQLQLGCNVIYCPQDSSSPWEPGAVTEIVLVLQCGPRGTSKHWILVVGVFQDPWKGSEHPKKVSWDTWGGCSSHWRFKSLRTCQGSWWDSGVNLQHFRILVDILRVLVKLRLEAWGCERSLCSPSDGSSIHETCWVCEIV